MCEHAHTASSSDVLFYNNACKEHQRIGYGVLRYMRDSFCTADVLLRLSHCIRAASGKLYLGCPISNNRGSGACRSLRTLLVQTYLAGEITMLSHRCQQRAAFYCPTLSTTPAAKKWRLSIRSSHQHMLKLRMRIMRVSAARGSSLCMCLHRGPRRSGECPSGSTTAPWNPAPAWA